MKLYFSEEELNYVGNFLGNLLATMKPPRKHRRNLSRLRGKFTPSAKYVWLKPGDRQQLATILNNGIRALEMTNDRLKDRKVLSKLGSFMKGNPEEKHLAKVGDVFDKVIGKLGA